MKVPLNTRELNLVKRRYCEDRHLQEKGVSFTAVRQDRGSGEYTFLVEREGSENEYYTHPRVDLTALTSFRALDIPAAYRNDFDAQHNPAFIADWIRRVTGHPLIDTDIVSLHAGRSLLSVVIAPDSMRFKGSFQLIRL